MQLIDRSPEGCFRVSETNCSVIMNWITHMGKMIGWKVNIAHNLQEISPLTQSEPTTRWRRQLNSADQESQRAQPRSWTGDYLKWLKLVIRENDGFQGRCSIHSATVCETVILSASFVKVFVGSFRSIWGHQWSWLQSPLQAGDQECGRKVPKYVSEFGTPKAERT